MFQSPFNGSLNYVRGISLLSNGGLVPENARSLVVGDKNITCSFLGSFLLLHQLGLLKDSLNLLKALKVSCFFY